MNRMTTTLMTTLEEARIWVDAALDGDGGECPCCERPAEIRKRTVHTSMASGLIRMYLVAAAGEWVTIKHHLNHLQLADAGKLAYWGLTEAKPGQRDDGSNRIGIWRVTDVGTAFVENRSTIIKNAYPWRGECTFDGPQVTIVQCLGKRFDYREMMQG